MPPHVYAITDQAYRNMLLGKGREREKERRERGRERKGEREGEGGREGERERERERKRERLRVTVIMKLSLLHFTSRKRLYLEGN